MNERRSPDRPSDSDPITWKQYRTLRDGQLELRKKLKNLIVLFVLLFGISAYSTIDQAKQTHSNQIAGCKRGNILRFELNRRTPGFIAMRDVLRDSLRTVIAQSQSGEEIDQTAIERYQKNLDLVSDIRFNQIEQIKCEEAYPEPKLIPIGSIPVDAR